nr:alanine--tRNA ligase [Polycyclovorans algicola]
MKFVDLATDVRYRLFYQIARSVGGLVRAPGPRASEYFLEGYVDTNAGCEQIVVVQAPVNFSEFQVEVDLAELLENSSLQPAPQQIHYRVLGDALGQDVLSRVEGALSRAHAIFNARLQNRSEVSGTVDGRDVFKLYDTYGFPLDLTADIARERGLTLDVDGYEREMTAQRNRARAASGFKADAKLSYDGAATCFVGYDRLKAEATVVGLFREGQPVDALQAGEAGVVVLDSTPFYAESGGQVGDVGHITPHASRLTPHGFIVEDTLKIKGSVFGHHGRLAEGVLSVGDAVIAEVTESVRRASMRNHSATHLLHRALRDVLGDHVAQKGSLVDADKTRFDFSHPQPVTADELVEIENRVNRGILANVPVQAELMAFDDAIASGAMALFGEKYGDEVRVLSMGDYSTELCGGTHVTRTGDIGLFKIVSEGGVASGIRRVEAITGENALGYLRGLEFTLKTAADRLRGSREELVEKLDAQLERAKALEKEVAALKGKLAGAASGDLLSQARDIKGVKVLAAQVDGVSGNDLRDLQDQLKNKLGSGIVVLGAADGDKVSLIAGVTQDLVGRIKAGDIIKAVAAQVGGKGGGRPDMAQAGGTDASALPAALESVYSQVEGHLS